MMSKEEVKNRVVGFIQWLTEKYGGIPNINIETLYYEFLKEVEEEESEFDIMDASPVKETVKRKIAVPYQLCPKCLGRGFVSNLSLSAYSTDNCDVCNGQKIIPMYVVHEND